MATTADERREWWTASGQIQLRQLLYWLWDPIGVKDYFPTTHDEYDCYADAMRDLMVEDADEDTRAAGVLREVRRAQVAMGFEQKEFAQEDRRSLTEMTSIGGVGRSLCGRSSGADRPWSRPRVPSRRRLTSDGTDRLQAVSLPTRVRSRSPTSSAILIASSRVL